MNTADRQPFGLTEEEMKRVVALATLADTPGPKGLLLALEAHLLSAHKSHDPRIGLILDHYRVLKQHAFDMACALSALVHYAETNGCDASEAREILESYVTAYPEQ